jgi:hypothetical protein
VTLAPHKSATLFRPWSPWRNLWRSRNPLATLQRRSRLRQISSWALPLNWAALGIAFFLMIAAQTDISVAGVALFGLTGWVLQSFRDGPHTHRPARIIADRRPVLRKRVLIVPPQRREVRILRSRPSPIVLTLPPSRPRSRALLPRPVITEETEY